MRRPIVLLLSLGFLVPALAAGATRRVPSEYPTLVHAIAAAQSGDEVVVAPGTYTGVGNRDLSLLGKDIVVRSEAGPSATVLACSGLGRAFSITSGEPGTARIEGFRIENGAHSSRLGGGIYIEVAQATISNCEFVGCEARQGGAILCGNGSRLRLESCSFLGNRAIGGFYPDNGRGGAAHLSSGAVVEFYDCLLQGNYAQGGDSHSPDGCGSAICGDSGSSLTIEHSSIVEHGTAFGYAVSSHGQIAARWSLFRHNEHGALYAGGASPLTVEHCTFVDNYWALGAFASTSSIRSSLFVRNGEHLQCSVPSSLNVECCDFYYPFPSPSGCWVPLVGSNGNVNVDPRLCNAETGDFHLQWGSPCLPANSGDCGLIGAFGFGACGSIPVTPASWGRLKAMYR